jgi:hypothetical protein
MAPPKFCIRSDWPISFGKSPNAPIIDLHTGHLAKNLNRTIEIGNGVDLGKIVAKSDFPGADIIKSRAGFLSRRE